MIIAILGIWGLTACSSVNKESDQQISEENETAITENNSSETAEENLIKEENITETNTTPAE